MVSSLRLRRILIVLLAVISGLGLVVELVHNLAHTPASETLVSLLSLSYEGNVPTWYVSCLTFCCALMLTVIAADASRRQDAHRWHWRVLALMFFYISLDESVGIHENLGGLVEAHGVLYFSWVIPAAVFVVVFAAAYVRFLLSLPRTTALRFCVAGALYVLGALVMELPLGYWTERSGNDNLVYALIDFVEETLELCGVSLFLVALWDHFDMEARFQRVMS